MSYAHLGPDGTVIEIIEDVERVQMPAPDALPEGAQLTPEQMVAREVQQYQHDNFEPGILPLVERFHPDMLSKFFKIPDGVEAKVGDVFSGGKYTTPPTATAPPPTKEELTAALRNAIHDALNKSANAWGFLHMDNAMSYLHSKVEALHKDAYALLHWRDAVHEWQAEFMAAINAGEATLPNDPAVMTSALPALPQQPSKQ